MTKLKAVRWKTRQQKPQSLYCTSILAQAPIKSQRFRIIELSNYIASRKLTNAIRRWQLTESLEILEQYGFHDDLAVLVISELQNLLGRVAR